MANNKKLEQEPSSTNGGGQSTTSEKLTNKDHVNNIVGMFNGYLHYVNMEPYTYKDGHWLMVNERVEVAQRIAHYLGRNVSRSGISELLSLVQTFQARSEQAVAPDMNLLCLMNGTLDLRTGKLIEHSPAHNLKCQINCAWDPTEPCHRWDQFLEEIFDGDTDIEAKIQLVKEWFGYCLTTDISQHKFLWLVGPGGNGKSVILDVLRQLVGASNVSDAHVERLSDKGVRAELENKLVNISAEMSAEATISDGYLKSIVAGDFIEAERKYKPSFSFRPYVKMVGATNNLPRLLDLSDGFFRRAILLQLNRKFVEGERDTRLTERLIAELPGILDWAVEGLMSLRKRGNFIIPASSLEALNQYRQTADPDRMYFEECLVEDPEGAGLTPETLYSGYRKYCRSFGYREKAINNFGKRLAEFGVVNIRTHRGKRWLVKQNPTKMWLWE